MSRRRNAGRLAPRPHERLFEALRGSGWRRTVLLRREGWRVNAKRVYRLYRELGLQLRNKVPKRRVKAKLRDGRRAAVRANETWAMDLVHDQLATGRKLRVLTVVDTFTRYASAIVPRFSFKAVDLAPKMSSFIGRVCSGYAPDWGVWQRRLV